LRSVHWFSWLLGLALLATVVGAALHFTEEREFLRVAEYAHPWWLGAALALQAATYLAQGATWRVVARAGGVSVSRALAYKLSLAQLFVDQALPSGGISGTVVVARAFERRGVPRAVVMASVLVDAVAYYLAYVLVVGAALVAAQARGQVTPLVLALALVLVAFSVALTTAALALAGSPDALPQWLGRIALINTALALIGAADRTLARSLPLIAKSVLFHAAIVLLDAATLWVLIRSLGAIASPVDVYTSFIASSLLRTISIVPGGLGVFEAASVVTLQHVGVALPVALAATLMFRGLSFWLPMVPGIVCSRELQRAPG